MGTLLDSSHPSFGCKSAWFQFAILSSDGAIRKLLVVEANSEEFVETLELLLLVDGFVSKTCHVVSVFRESDSVGMRSPIIEESSMIEFMADIVDTERLRDSRVLQTFVGALTSAQRNAFRSKLEARAERVESSNLGDGKLSLQEIANSKPEVPPVPERSDILISSLVGLNFNKGAVVKWVTGQGNKINDGTIQDQIRLALSYLAP